jgi:hypothetical protein
MEDDDTVSDQKVNVGISLEAEYFKFLQGKLRTIYFLKDYPKVRKLFKKFITPLPSSALVEPLFYAAGDVLTAKRNHLEDAKIEKLLLLKVNYLLLKVH